MKPEDIWTSTREAVRARFVSKTWAADQPVTTWTTLDVERVEYARLVADESLAPATVWRDVWIERIDIDETPNMWRARLHLLLGPPEEIERRRAFAATRCPTCGRTP